VSATREPGRITLVAKCFDRHAWAIRFEGDNGGVQSLSICINDDTPADRAFREELAAFFGVRWIHDAVGRRCFALRCFDINHEPIEGFEVDGKRWLLTDFRRRFWPDGAVTRLDQRAQACRDEIRFFRRRIAEEEAILAKLGTMFVDWSATSEAAE